VEECKGIKGCLEKYWEGFEKNVRVIGLEQEECSWAQSK